MRLNSMGMMTPSTSTASDRGSGQGSSSSSSFVWKYCRMCALELKQGVFIFGEEGKRLQLAEKIRKTLSILVLEEDSLPKKICTECCSSLEDYSQYKDSVLDAQDKLASIAKSLERSQGQNLLHLQIQQQQQHHHALKSRRAVAVAPQKPLPASPSPPQSPLVAEPVEDSFNSPDPDNHHNLNNSNSDDGVEEVSENSPVSGTIERECEGVSPPKAARLCFENKAMSKEYTTKFNEPLPIASSSTAPSTVTHAESTDTGPNSTEDTWTLICGLCGMLMEDRIHLESHHKKKHDTIKYVAPVFGCSVCPRICENYNALRMHIYRHRKEGSFECLECEKTFPLKDQLDRHNLAAHNPAGKAFTCKLCGRGFSAKCSLAFHMTSKHYGSEPETHQAAGAGDNVQGTSSKVTSESYSDHNDNDSLVRSPERIGESRNDLEKASTEIRNCFKTSDPHKGFRISPKKDERISNFVSSGDGQSHNKVSERLPPNIAQVQDRPPPNIVQERPPPNIIQERPPPNIVQERSPSNTAPERPPPNIVPERPTPSIVSERPIPNIVPERPITNIVPERPTLSKVQERPTPNIVPERPMSIIVPERPSLNASTLPSLAHTEKTTEADLGSWKCEYCDKIFQTEPGYKCHVATHKGKRFVCDHCGAIFTQKGSLTHHISSTHNESPKNFRCEICSKDFATVKLLKMHKLFHVTDKNPVKCTICQKEYRSEIHLKSHMKTHSETKNFMCATCGKTFRNQAKLSNHENIHTGAKPYECPDCDFATASTGPYYKHLKRHREKGKSSELLKKPSPPNATFNEQVKEIQSATTSAATSEIPSVVTDLTTKSPQKTSPVQASSNQSNVISVTSTGQNITHIQQQPQTSLAHSHSVVGGSNNIVAHHGSQVSVIEGSHFQSHLSSSTTGQGHEYSQQQQAHQVWGSLQSLPSNVSHGGRSYQNHSNSAEAETPASHSSSTGMHPLDLVDCAIQHGLISEDLSSHSHQAHTSQTHHHAHNYSPSQHNPSVSHSSSVPQNSNHSHHNSNNIAHHQSFASASVVVTGSVTNVPTISTGSNLTSITNLSTSHSHHNNSHNNQPHQSEPIELSYKLQIDNSGFQDMPMELTKVFQRDPLELCVRQDFNPLMDLSSRVSDPSGGAMSSLSMNSINVNSGNVMNSGGGGMNGMSMGGYHKMDLADRELTFSDLSGAFRQPIDLIARTIDSPHELCSEGNLVDLSLRSSFGQDQSASTFLRELIDLSARSDSSYGELNLTNKNHHQTQAPHPHTMQQHSHQQHSQHHHGNSSISSTQVHRHIPGGNGNHHQSHHSNGTGSFQNVIYQDAMFHIQN